MSKKISKIAKDLNVSLSTVFEFLRKNDIAVEEHPNARIDDRIESVLINEFQHDQALKNKSSRIMSDRKKEPRQAAKTIMSDADVTRPETKTPHSPKILGKLEFDSSGKPVVKSSASQNTPNQKPQQTQVPQQKPKNTAEKPVENKTEVKTADEQQNRKNEEEVKNVPAPAPGKAKANNEKSEYKAAAKTVAKVDVSKNKEEDPVTENKQTQTENEEIFKPATEVKPALNLNIVGKIDLSAINQSTRPKKRGKEEKRADRRQNAQNAPAGTPAANGDRKKRRRISGKEKVDIEKTSQQTSGNSQQGGGKSRDEHRRQPQENKKANPRRQVPVHTEVSEEDVSKQVKETLARLTAKEKGLKKGAKWRKEKREANASREREAMQNEMEQSKVLKLTEFVTANDLAVMMDVPINQVIATCMNIGVMVSINQRLDAETINIVADEFGFKTEYVSAEVADAIHQEEDREEDLVPRPPVVTVMGHVDHGKTSLLDYIRKANVIAGEAGGITQHIGAYNVKLEDGRHITFLDTPGHEAFTAMRARGAKITDLCIIIVAADDNVMPQTIEAINHASAAGVPMVFAINKIDKPHANPEKIKEELAAMNYLVEDWGGKYQSQDISAKKGIGVNELMEKVLLEAELLELKANPNKNAIGSIIESSLDKGRGYVATVLVQNGTLHVGDIVIAGNHFGKVKAMFNERNQRIKEAGPSMPVLILGLNGAPQAGDTFNVLDTEQEAREIANKREQLQREMGLRTTKILTLEDIGRRRAIGNFQELNIIVKGDVDGSIEALSDSLIKLSTEEIEVKVLHKAVGEISESDVTLAAASDAIIIGFQVRPSMAARREAEREGVQIRLYSVIYQAIEDVKDAMSGMLAPEIKEEVIGTAEVKETYHISKVGTIAGCIVREGKIRKGTKCRLIRDGIVKYTGELGSLKRFKDDAKEVLTGQDCGMSIAGYNDIKVGDLIECFEEKEVSRSID